ncbi:MAG: response regulator transcription factor [Cellvibrionaceae bacterium]|nr:response regulator transcription factor [Cellvibrionaceae bacterium]
MLTLSILLIEDHSDIAKNIAHYMSERGHSMDFANNGQQGLALALANYYDLVILDIMLPKLDGWQVCKLIREKAERQLPILMLTARDTLDDKVQGFQFGADDYLTKPFSLIELEMRCLALGRRRAFSTEKVVTLGALTIDRNAKRVKRDGQLIQLPKIPYTILQVIVESYPRVVSRSELYQRIWGDELTESDALRSHIYQLRQALDKPFDFAMLKTVHGVGFTLELEDEN